MTTKRAKPLDPIRLWPTDGEILPEPWRRAAVLPDDPPALKEDDRLPSFGDALGEHALCGGVVAWHQTAPESAAVVCKKCFFRLVVPIPATKTWGDLRAFCEQFNPKPETDPC